MNDQREEVGEIKVNMKRRMIDIRLRGCNEVYYRFEHKNQIPIEYTHQLEE